MGTTIYRATGIGLAVTIALLGTAISILLYYAGKAAIVLFYTNNTYMDEYKRINQRMPTDDWYGELVLRGWALGFVYIIPGLSGITASLFFNKYLMGIHTTIATLALFVGSFLHSAGGIAIIMYRVLMVEGATRHNPWLGDCIYVSYNAVTPYEYVDERCLTRRHALLLCIVAACVMLVAWIFVLANLLYVGFTFHTLGKVKKDTYTIPDRPRNQGNFPSTSTELVTLPQSDVTKAENSITEGTAVVAEDTGVEQSEAQDPDTPSSVVVDTT